MNTLDTTIPYERNWIQFTERFPFISYKFRAPGQVPAQELTIDLQQRFQNLKGQLAASLKLGCSCKVSGMFLRSVPPHEEQPEFSVSHGSQAIVDLQTGDLYYSTNPQEVIQLGKAQSTDWQYFLQFSIN